MSNISKDDIFKAIVTALLSILSFIGMGIHSQQSDVACRLRIVELNQARIMERMGVESLSYDVNGLRHTQK